MRAPLVALILPALLAAPLAAQDFSWTGTLARGQTLEVRGISGRIHAVAARGSEARVTATKHARRDDPDDVVIKAVEHDGGVTICALYPTRRGGDMECRPHHGQGDTRNSDVEVAFEVEVPAGVTFAGETVNGDVSATNLPGDAAISTVNGDVDVSAAGVVEATTVNGSVEAEMGRLPSDRPLSLTTVNGGITLTLPAGAGMQLEATTVNGGVESDFPITISGRMRPNSLRGQVGEGGPRVKLTTVNGGIRVRKR